METEVTNQEVTCAPAAGIDALFGDVREALHGPPSARSWTVVLQTTMRALGSWPDRVATQWIPYIESALERWPDERRVLGTRSGIARVIVDRPGHPLIGLFKRLDVRQGDHSVRPLDLVWAGVGPGLTQLSLVGLDCSDPEALDTLVGLARACGGLERLELHAARLSQASWHELLDSYVTLDARHVLLRNMSTPWVHDLACAFAFGSMETLELASCVLDADPILGHGLYAPSRLQSVRLRDITDPSGAGVTSLARLDGLRLEELVVRGTPLSQSSVQELAGMLGDGALESLTISV